MKTLDVIGSFYYREPVIPQLGKRGHSYPKVTLYGNQRLKPFFSHLCDVINSQVELKLKREHEVAVDMVGEGKGAKLKLVIDGKLIIMVPVP